MRRRRGDRRPVPAWLRVIVLAMLAVLAVKYTADALQLHAESDVDCPTVSDLNPGRGLDFECSTYGGTSKDSAVAMLASLGLVFGGGTVLGAISVVRGMGRPGESAGDALADDLAELDDLHKRGLLTDEERQAAIERRLRGR